MSLLGALARGFLINDRALSTSTLRVRELKRPGSVYAPHKPSNLFVLVAALKFNNLDSLQTAVQSGPRRQYELDCTVN